MKHGRCWQQASLCLALIVMLWSADLRAAEPHWTSLFDGKTLKGWKVTNFGGPPDEVHVENGTLILEMGAAELSGVTRTAPVPRIDYEVVLQAMRVEGGDFFCGLTFPVQDACCSLIVGGWGGSLVGLSSLDDLDASQNETTRFITFANKHWYTIRLMVTETRIQAWIDDKRIIDVRPEGRRISVRYEVEKSRPFGLAAWNTKAAFKNIKLRQLDPAEVKAADTAD